MRAPALPLLALLAACSGERDAAPTPRPTATIAAPRTLVAADFDPGALGAGIAGMERTAVEMGGGLGTVTGYVTCPRSVTTCDPATAPAGTVYTYVLTIEPTAKDAPSPMSTGTETPVEPVEAPAELVRMIRPAPGFNGGVGYSRAEATAALGVENALTVTLDQNQLIWRVTRGTGWAAGKPLTLWWQSTAAPAKPSVAYRLEYAGEQADIVAPFPAADKAVEPRPAR